MKFDDLNDNLNEGPISGPAGFAARAKAKLQKNIPFAKQQRRRGEDKDKIYKLAKSIKDDFKAWVSTKYGSASIDNAGITMPEFLAWMKDESEVGAQAETFARGDKAYADFFAQEVDDEGNQTSTASDPKVKVNDPDEISPGKVSNSPPEKVSDEDKKAGFDKINRDAEEESRANNPDDTGIEGDGTKQDVKASKGDDKEPKVDTSASIYESRFQAMLVEDTEDVGVNRAKTLQDNQIDTLIIGAIRAGKSSLGQKKTNPEQTQAEPKQAEQEQEQEQGKVGKTPKAKAAPSSEGSSDGISLDKSEAKNTKILLKKSIAGQEFDDKDRKAADKIVKYLNKYV